MKTYEKPSCIQCISHLHPVLNVHELPFAFALPIQVSVCIFLKLRPQTPSKIQWDLKNGPLSQSLELLDTQAAGSVQWVLLEMSWTNTWQVIIFLSRFWHVKILRHPIQWSFSSPSLRRSQKRLNVPCFLGVVKSYVLVGWFSGWVCVFVDGAWLSHVANCFIVIHQVETNMFSSDFFFWLGWCLILSKPCQWLPFPFWPLELFSSQPGEGVLDWKGRLEVWNNKVLHPSFSFLSMIIYESMIWVLEWMTFKGLI